MNSFFSLNHIIANLDNLINLISSFPDYINERHRALSENLISTKHKSLMNDSVSGLSRKVRGIVNSLNNRVKTLRESQEWKILNVGFFGETNAGKSTIIEALSQGDGSSIGDGRKDYTREVLAKEVDINGYRFKLIDMPGIEGKEKHVEEKIKNAVSKCHVVFFVSGAGREVERGTLEKLKSYLSEKALVFGLLNRRSNIQLLKHSRELLNEDIAKVANRVHQQMKSVLGNHYGGEVMVVDALLAFLGRGRPSKTFPGINLNFGKGSKFVEYKEKLLQIFGREDKLIEASGLNRLLTKLNEIYRMHEFYIFKYNTSKIVKEMKDCLRDIEKEVGKFKSDLSFDPREYYTLTDLKTELNFVRSRIKATVEDILEDIRNRIVEEGVSRINKGEDSFSIDTGKYIKRRIDEIQRVVMKEVKKFDDLARKRLGWLRISAEHNRTLSVSSDFISSEASDWEAFKDFLKGSSWGAAAGVLFGPAGLIIASVAGGLFNLFASEEDRKRKRIMDFIDAVDERISFIKKSILEQIDSMLSNKEAELDKTIKLAEQDPEKIKGYIAQLESKFKEIVHEVDSFSNQLEALSRR